MNKLILSLICAVVLIGNELHAQEDTYTTYQFLSEKDGSSLAISRKNISLKKSSEVTNEITEFFIIKRLPEGGSLIASALNNTLFLGRKGNKVGLYSMDEKNLSHFKWEILYAGYPFCYLMVPDNPNKALAIVNGDLQIEKIPALSDNNDQAANSMRFRLETLFDTF